MLHSLMTPNARRASPWAGEPHIGRPAYEHLEHRRPVTRVLQYQGVQRYAPESELEGHCRSKPALSRPYYPSVANECESLDARRSTGLGAAPSCGTGPLAR